MAGLVARAALFMFTVLGVRAGRIIDSEPHPQVEFALQYNETEAKLFAYFSQAAYCDPDALQKWDCGVSCDETHKPTQLITIAAGEAHGVPGFVAKLQQDDGTVSTGRCVASFRGTTSWQDLRTNASALQVSWAGCKACTVHMGFAKAYNEIRKPLWDALSSLRCTRVIFTGHSLGGAIALLGAADVLMSASQEEVEVGAEWPTEGMKVEALWTYGKPRVGNAAFVQAFMTAADAQRVGLWRVVHARDPVPRGLPRTFGFEHEPNEVYYPSSYDKDGENEYLICPQELDGLEARSPSCSGGVSLRSLVLRDHEMYVGVKVCGIPDVKCRRTIDRLAELTAEAASANLTQLVANLSFIGIS